MKRWQKRKPVAFDRAQRGLVDDVVEIDRAELEEIDAGVPIDLHLRELNERGLRPFQVDGARWLAARRRAALCDEQGTGKSAQILRALAGRAAIVVCPAALRLYWRDEAAKWSPSTRVRLAPAGELEAPAGDELVVVSYDGLPETASRARFDHVQAVFDEAQLAKGEGTDRSTRARALGAAAGGAWVSTGTPLAGTPEDLWNVLALAGLEREAFGSWDAFERAFGGVRVGRSIDWPRDPPDARFISSSLSRVMLRRLRRDVLPELPEKDYEQIAVEVPPELVAKLSDTDRAWRAIGLDKLPPFDLVSAVQRALASSRIEAVKAYCATREEPLVLFSAHQEPVEAFERVPGWGTITGERATMCDREGRFACLQSERGRARVVARFMSGELHNIALTIRVAGFGLTLTRSSHVVRVSRSYTPSDNEQAEDRVARIGQASQSILVTDFISDHVVERRLLEICAIKTARINATINAAAVKGAPSPA